MIEHVKGGGQTPEQCSTSYFSARDVANNFYIKMRRNKLLENSKKYLHQPSKKNRPGANGSTTSEDSDSCAIHSSS